MIPHRSSVPLLSTLLLALSTVSCAEGELPLSRSDWERIYTLTLDVIHESLDEPEEFFVDQRPRFILMSEDGAMRMGEFNAYGDPALASAIAEHRRASPCKTESRGGCSQSLYVRFIEISEVIELSPRDAGVMVSTLDVESERGGTLVIALMRTRRDWRVDRVDHSDEARVR